MLGVNPEVASEDACKVEHDISNETFSKIREFVGEQGVQPGEVHVHEKENHKK